MRRKWYRCSFGELTVKLEIESTAEIVAIDGVPCRKWSILRIDGTPDLSGAAVFTRLLMLPKSLEINDPTITNLDGPYPPTQSDLPAPAPELDDTVAEDDEIDSFSVSA
jgi:hypothetical protein